MSSFEQCKKKLAGRISDADIKAIEDTAATFTNVEPNAAYLAAINSHVGILQAERTSTINDIVKDTKGKKTFAAAAPVVPEKLVQVETKKPEKPVQVETKKPKPKPKKKKVTKPLFAKAPEQGVKESIKGKLEEARIAQIEEDTKVFTEENLAELKEALLEVPVEEPTSTFVVKNKEAARRALAMVKTDDSSIRKNNDGTFTVEVKVPSAEFQAQDIDAPAARVAEQTAKVFDLGREVKDRKIELMDTNKVVKGRNPRPPANITEIVKLGTMLSGKPIDYAKNLSKQVRDNLMEGLAYLQDRGYELETRKGDKLGLPGDLIVFGRNITLNNLAQVSKELQSISQELHKLEKTRFKDPVAMEQYRALRTKLEAYEISDRDSNLEAQDFDDVTGMPETEDRSFMSLTPEYMGKGQKKQFTHVPVKEYEVENIGNAVSSEEATYVGGLLKHLGIKTSVRFVSENNVEFMIRGLEDQMRTDPKNADTYRIKRDQFESLQLDQPEGRIHYFDNLPNVVDRVPVIFISKRVPTEKRVRVITHELGHLVQRVMLDRASEETQLALRNGANMMTEAAFREWFANQLLVWSTNRAVPKSMIEKFFKLLGQKLKQLFNYVNRKLPLNETYAEFMDAMVSAEGQRQKKAGRMKTRLGRKFEEDILNIPTAGPYLLRSGMNQYADFTPMTPGLKSLLQGGKIKAKSAFDRVAATKFGGDMVKVAGQTGDTFLALHNALIRSADAKLRAMNNPTATWIADQWHIRSGQGRTRNHKTIPTEINKRGARFHDRIKKLSQNVMPRKYGKVVDTIFGMEAGRLDKSSVIYTEIGNILVLEKDLSTHMDRLNAEYNKETVDKIIAGYNETRLYLDDLYVYLTGDFTKQRSDSKLATKDNLGLPVKYRKNYFPHALDVTAITNEKAEFMRILKEEKVFKDNQQAEDFYQQLVMSDGTIMDMAQDIGSDVLGPSFSGLSARIFSPKLVQKLQKFYINDTMSVLTTYTHSAIKRGVIQKRFNPDNKMRVDRKTGMSKFDPLYELNERLENSDMTQEQIKDTRKIIEAYLGRLGANMNPKLRNMSALMVTYQNMRLLSFVVLSSVVDAGLIDSRSGALFTSLKEAFRLLSDKQQRKELYEAAAMIGAIRDDITEHVVNDQQSMTYMSHRMKAGNEAFFRLVRMHQWTNLSRVMALSAGKNFMIKHANRPNSKQSQKYLKELGLTAEEVLDWDGNISTASDNISTALHQFIDESVIRPGAPIRPDWASDPHWAIFFHLKQFMWGYHETILRRVWQQTKDNEGLYKVVPIMLLAAATLPLAAAGYELRRWLGGAPAYTDKEGGDYFWELVQRSGGPGIMQLWIDADEAEEFGQFAPFAVAGPAISQLTDFFNKDFDVALARSLPFVAQMPALRNYITGN